MCFIRGSRGSTTTRSRAGTFTSLSLTGTCDRATACTRLWMSIQPTSGCSNRSRLRRECILPPGEYQFVRYRSNVMSAARRRLVR